ncbi:hypothetical protein NCS52_00765700 [Fusarium sp. LHS14.1]|nr:hypothetical protein NCS52_00765700 [Fusarium sp. LHS14.1]
MVFPIGIVLLGWVAFCAATETASAEVQRLSVTFEKSKLTGTVLTTVYDVEENDKKLHCAACSNKLTISDLKLDVEFNIDDYGHGTLRVSETEIVVDASSKEISGFKCSTSFSNSHVKAECVLPLDSHHKPLSLPSPPSHGAVKHLRRPYPLHHLERPHHRQHPHYRYRVGPQVPDNLLKNPGHVPIYQQVKRPYLVKPAPIPHAEDDGVNSQSHPLGWGSSDSSKTYNTISKRGEGSCEGGREVKKYADGTQTLLHWNC